MPILKTYVPCLRWKQGEYQAVMRLSTGAKLLMTPLIEVPEIGFDFETRQPKKTIDGHLEPLAKRILTKWGKDPCLVDFRLIDQQERMANGEHPIRFLFREFREKEIQAIPILRINDDPECIGAIAQEATVDNLGVSLRVNIASLARSDFEELLLGVIEATGASIEETIIIVDLEAPNFEPVDIFANLVTTLLGGFPFLERWRSIAIIGTSFPSTIAEVSIGLNLLPRYEWILYEILIDRLRQDHKPIPSFGDYAINHPDLLQKDMRIVKPYASLRYTIEQEWLIGKGRNVRDYGFGQYREICRQVVQSPYFSGREFSAGDKYIEDCANGNEKTGNLTTWRWVGTNHHIERIVTDLANFDVL